MAYTVWRGKEVGVFNDWSETEPLVRGFRAAKFKRFDSYSEALLAFQVGHENYINTDVLKKIKNESLVEEELKENSLVCFGKFYEDRMEVDVYVLDPEGGEFKKVNTVRVFDANYNVEEFVAVMECFRMVCESPEYSHIKHLYTNNTASVHWARSKRFGGKFKNSLSLKKTMDIYLAYFEVYGEVSLDFKKIPSSLKSSLELSLFV